MSITFDGTTKRIVIDEVGSDIVVSAKEIYSRWKDWVAAGNAGFEPALRTIGGDTLGSGVTAGDYYFLNNSIGWRIRPKEANHKLTITGNLYGEDPNTAILASTLGNYNVLVSITTSSLTQTVATGGVDPSEVADAILDGSSIESGISFRKSLRGMLAVLFGVMTKSGNTVTYRDAGNNTKDRVVSQVSSGGRTINLDLDD